MPKSYNNLYPLIYDFQNLYNAFKKASRGKRYRNEALKFKTNLEENLIDIQDFLITRLALKLNPKTRICPYAQGVDFAGYRTWPTHILPRKRNVKRAKRMFKKLMKDYALGIIGLGYIKPRLMSFLGYMKHCDGYTTLHHILSEFVLKR